MNSKKFTALIIESITLFLLFASTLTSCSLYPHYSKRRKIGAEELAINGFKDYKAVGYGVVDVPKAVKKNGFSPTLHADIFNKHKYTELVGSKNLEDIENFTYQKKGGGDFNLDLNLTSYYKTGDFVFLSFTDGRDPNQYQVDRSGFNHIDDYTYDFVFSLKSGKLYSLNEIGRGNDYIPDSLILASGKNIVFAETTVQDVGSKSWYNPTYALYSETEEGLEIYDLKNLMGLIGNLARNPNDARNEGVVFFDKYNNLYIKSEYVYTYERRMKKLESGVEVKLLVDKTPVLFKGEEVYKLDKDLNRTLLEDFDKKEAVYRYTNPSAEAFYSLYEDENQYIFIDNSYRYRSDEDSERYENYICYANFENDEINLECVVLEDYSDYLFYSGEGKIVYGSSMYRIREYDIFNRASRVIFDKETNPNGFGENGYVRCFVPAFDDIYFAMVEDLVTCKRTTGYYKDGKYYEADIDNVYLDKMIENVLPESEAGSDE